MRARGAFAAGGAAGSRRRWLANPLYRLRRWWDRWRSRSRARSEASEDVAVETHEATVAPEAMVAGEATESVASPTGPAAPDEPASDAAPPSEADETPNLDAGSDVDPTGWSPVPRSAEPAEADAETKDEWLERLGKRLGGTEPPTRKIVRLSEVAALHGTDVNRDAPASADVASPEAKSSPRRPASGPPEAAAGTGALSLPTRIETLAEAAALCARLTRVPDDPSKARELLDLVATCPNADVRRAMEEHIDWLREQ